MDQSPTLHCDVVVVGAGPAGATAAALMAQAGLKVQLIERARFPRFHIGESLLPYSMPILERIGALEEVERVGVPKYAADFTAPCGRQHEVRFDRALKPGPSRACHVKRAEFDAVLLDAARRHGAEIWQETTVRRAELDDPSKVRIEAQHADGSRRWLECKQLVDASGRDGLLARKFEMRVRNRHHQSAAAYSHYTGVPRREGEREGNISIYWFDHGWLWFIPLAGDLMSVGAVCRTDYFRARNVSIEQFLDDTISRAPEAAERMRTATRVEPVRAASNYSYQARRLSGPNYLLIGDAYVFVDPVFSSGVHFALQSAVLAADVIAARLRSPATARAKLGKMKRQMKRGLATMSWLIYRFPNPVMRHLFLAPRDLWGVERTIVSILSGDVFEGRGVAWRYRLFKLIYAGHKLWFKLGGPTTLTSQPAEPTGTPRTALGA